MKNLAVSLSLSLVALVACKGPSQSNQPMPSAYPNPEIQGDNWATSCVGDNRHKFRTVFADDVMVISADRYSNESCSGSVDYTISSEYEIVYGEASSIVEGAQNIDVTLKSMAVIPKSQEGLTQFRQMCGDRHWDINVATDISDGKCLTSDNWPESFPTPTKFGIMKKTPESLAIRTGMGLDQVNCIAGETCFDGSSPEYRIRDLSKSLTYFPE